MTMQLDRRQFIVTSAAVGGGLAIGFSFAGEAEAASVLPEPWDKPMAKGAVEFTPWVVIAPDDTVTVRVGTPDIGNGVMTQAAMSLTEELACDWNKVRAEYVSVNRNFVENKLYATGIGGLAFFSGRSTSKPRMDSMLQAGASARERLKAAAAARWKVPVAEIEAKDSVLTHKASGRTLRYGEVAAEAARIKLDPEPAPKPREQWTFLTKASPGRLQNPLIVTGQAVFGIDVKQPGMVYAALMQSPVHGGKLKSYDDSAVKKMPGVRAVVVVDPSEPRKPAEISGPFPAGFAAPQSAIAVIADHYWQARQGLEKLTVEWDPGPGGQWKTDGQMVEAGYAALAKEGEKIEASTGDMSLLDKQPKVVEARYETPYADHCLMEPLNGTCLVTADKVELWHPSQLPDMAMAIAAEETGMDPRNVFVHQTFVGGGFGRRAGSDDVRMVVAVARKYPGKPVKVVWSREETMRQGRYRPLMMASLKAGLDKSGMPVALRARASGKGIFLVGLSNTAYTSGVVPNVQVESQTVPFHVLTGAYRGPGYNSNAFFLETFIDECAAAAGIDPLEYRLKLLAKWPDKGWTMCLKEVQAKSGWGKKLPAGWGQGVAIANWGMGGKPEAGTTVACVATVEVGKDGKLTVHTLDVAFDTGGVVNRDAIETQIEGGVIFGLNMAMNDGLTVQDGRIVEGNFDTYPMLRTADMPQINIHWGGLSGHSRFSEIGEPPVGPIGPAIGNAIFKATGKRIRATPFRKQDLRWA